MKPARLFRAALAALSLLLPGCAGLTAAGPALQAADAIAKGVCGAVVGAATPQDALAAFQAGQRAVLDQAFAQIAERLDPKTLEALRVVAGFEEDWPVLQRSLAVSSSPDRVAGILVNRLARRLWGALGQFAPHPPIVVRWTGRRGRAGGRARRQPPQLVTLRIGDDCDRAALMMVLLHELTHVALGPHVAAHGREFNTLLTRVAAVVWRVSVPTRGLGYKPSRALETALRAMLNRRARTGAEALDVN